MFNFMSSTKKGESRNDSSISHELEEKHRPRLIIMMADQVAVRREGAQRAERMAAPATLFTRPSPAPTLLQHDAELGTINKSQTIVNERDRETRALRLTVFG